MCVDLVILPSSVNTLLFSSVRCCTADASLVERITNQSILCHRAPEHTPSCLECGSHILVFIAETTLSSLLVYIIRWLTFSLMMLFRSMPSRCSFQGHVTRELVSKTSYHLLLII